MFLNAKCNFFSPVNKQMLFQSDFLIHHYARHNCKAKIFDLHLLFFQRNLTDYFAVITPEIMVQLFVR